MEYHPILDKFNLSVPYSKVILGSFPVWSLTQHIDEKSKCSLAKGEFPFFFGSSRNYFWRWYQKYVDSKIVLLDKDSIQNSLKQNKISITDIILSCKRKGTSSLDKDLSQRIYNHSFLKIPKDGEILKILCTSKGLLNEMLLSNDFFQKYKNLDVDKIKSLTFQNNYLQKIGGSIAAVKKPIFIELKIEGTTGIIQCLAIPSPGSPYRKLIDFGIDKNLANNYLDSYLYEAFNWFIL